MFRHTALHRRAKREFFERRDLALLLHASMVSAACDGKSGSLSAARMELTSALFPYVNVGQAQNEANYDQYFDEIDAIEAEKKSGQVGGSPS